MNPDQTTPKGAFQSRSILFAIWIARGNIQRRDQRQLLLNSINTGKNLLDAWHSLMSHHIVPTCFINPFIKNTYVIHRAS